MKNAPEKKETIRNITKNEKCNRKERNNHKYYQKSKIIQYMHGYWNGTLLKKI